MIKGLQSIAFKESPYLVSSASVVGKKEGEGGEGGEGERGHGEKRVREN